MKKSSFCQDVSSDAMRKFKKGADLAQANFSLGIQPIAQLLNFLSDD